LLKRRDVILVESRISTMESTATTIHSLSGLLAAALVCGTALLLAGGAQAQPDIRQPRSSPAEDSRSSRPRGHAAA
jgi:hypothetical protein